MAWPKGKKRGFKTPGAGRKAGTPNKDTQPLREMILQALSDQPGGGIGYLTVQAKSNPSTFMTLLGRVLPMQVTGEGGGPVVIEIVRFGEKNGS